MEFEEDLQKIDFPEFDIVTIHGVFHSRQCPWEDDGSRPRWLRRSLFKDTFARLLAFSYGGVIDGGNFHTNSGLHTAARNLLDSIKASREEDNNITPIYFLVHDMGGIVLKKAIVLATQSQEKYGDILKWTRGITFLGCPHRAISVDKLGDQLAGWMHNHEPFVKVGLTTAARSLATAILEINGLFLDTGVLFRSRIMNIASTHPESPKQVFSEYTATLDVPGEIVMTSTQPLATLLCGPHHDVAMKHLETTVADILGKSNIASRPPRTLESCSNTVCVTNKELKMMNPPIPPFMIVPKLNHSDGAENLQHIPDSGSRLTQLVTSVEWEISSESEKGLLRQLISTPPLYLELDERVDVHILDWLKNSADFNRWFKGHGPRILHFSHSMHIRVNVLGGILRYLESPRAGDPSPHNHVFYFRFRKDDVRFSSIWAMMSMFVAQATNSGLPKLDLEPSANGILSSVTSNGSLSELNLLQFFRSVCAAYRQRGERVILIIWHCGNYSGSLSSLIKFVANIDAYSEAPCKIFLESSISSETNDDELKGSKDHAIGEKNQQNVSLVAKRKNAVILNEDEPKSLTVAFDQGPTTANGQTSQDLTTVIISENEEPKFGSIANMQEISANNSEGILATVSNDEKPTTAPGDSQEVNSSTGDNEEPNIVLVDDQEPRIFIDTGNQDPNIITFIENRKPNIATVLGGEELSVTAEGGQQPNIATGGEDQESEKVTVEGVQEPNADSVISDQRLASDQGEKFDREPQLIWDAENSPQSKANPELPEIDPKSELDQSPKIDTTKKAQESNIVVIAYDQMSTRSEDRGSNTSEVDQLLQRCPGLSSLSALINNVVARHRQNSTLDQVTIKWICCHIERISRYTSIEEVTAALEHLISIETQQLVVNIAGINTRHERGWEKRALDWVLHSFRPLTIWELECALVLGDELQFQRSGLGRTTDFIEHIQNCFSGLIVVENNEVLLVHPQVRDYLQGGSNSELQAQSKKDSNMSPIAKHSQELDTPQKMSKEPIITGHVHSMMNGGAAHTEPHIHILQSLLRCLTENIDLSLDLTASLSHKSLLYPMPCRFDLRFYAANHWLDHFRLVRQSVPRAAYELDLRMFLNHSPAVISWAAIMGTYLLSKGTPSPEEAQKGVLLLAARRGLEISDFDFLCPGWTSNDEMIETALLAAVEERHVSLIRSILGLFLPIQGSLITRHLLRAAAVSQDAEIIGIVLDIRDADIPLPRLLLTAAVRLGIEKIINMVVDGNYTIEHEDKIDQLMDAELQKDRLVEAIRFRQTHILPSLLPQNPDIERPLALLIMKEACKAGDPHVTQKIFNYCFEKNIFRDDDLKELILLACSNGNNDAVQRLIEKIQARDIDDALDFIKESLRLSVKNNFAACTRELLLLLPEPDARSSDARGSLWRILMEGVSEGNVEACQALIDAETDPNYLECWADEPVLAVALPSGSIDMLQLLMKHGAPLEAKNSYGNTPLYIAAGKGPVMAVSFLLEQKAKVNARAKFGGTPLYQACMKGRLDVVELLLQGGADINLATHSMNWSPLEASFDFPEILRLIVEKSPDFKRVASGATALWRAARGGFSESVELLLSGDPDLEFFPERYKPNDDGLTPLAVAARGGHAPVARLLLEAGANVNHIATAGRRQSVLTLADTDDVVAVALEYNPNLELTGQDGKTPLHHFVFHSDGDEKLPLIKRLVNAGAKIDALYEGLTALGIAVGRKNLGVAKFLLSRGADPDLFTGKWGSALHRACRFGSLEAVKLLVENNANGNLGAHRLGTPLTWACLSESQSFDKIEYLVAEGHANVTARGGWHGFALNEACLRCDRKTIEYLIDHGSESCLSETDDLGRPALFYACYRVSDALEVVNLLITKGASHRMKDKMGRTILHCAATQDDPKLVQKLIELENSWVHEADIDGWTPLHWATRKTCKAEPYSANWACPTSNRDRSEIVRLLKDGADLERVGKADGKEWTPLKLARYLDVYDELKELLTPGHATEQPEKYESKVGDLHSPLCDACFCEIRGINWRCADETCGDFDLCFKCAIYKDLLHDPSHELRRLGLEFAETTETESDDVGDDAFSEAILRRTSFAAGSIATSQDVHGDFLSWLTR